MRHKELKQSELDETLLRDWYCGLITWEQYCIKSNFKVNYIVVKRFPEDYGDVNLKIWRLEIKIKRSVYRVRDGLWRKFLKLVFPKTIGFIVLPNYIVMFRY